MEDLRTFHSLLLKWTGSINLISKNSISDAWRRHIEDSVQIYQYSETVEGHWVDLGSGGGLPAIVCAILARADNAKTLFTLVESDTRKATFLRTAARTLDLPVTVHAERVESLDPLGAEILSARAFAPLPKLLGLAHPHLSTNARLILPKGRQVEAEIIAAQKEWRFKMEKHPSITDTASAILVIGDVTHV